MPFWKRDAEPVDRISSEALADYGRFEFMKDQSGIDPPTAFGLISSLNELVYTATPTDRATLVAELRRHAEKGEWEKVGAWKYVRDWLSDEEDTRDLIDGGLLAISRMRVTNLAIHMAPIDRPRFLELTGSEPPNDGFFGPPVFDSNYGPTRQYYFDDAIARAAARTISRLPSIPGVEPGDMQDAVRSMWDFGLLIYRGPLVISPDIAFEANVVRPAVAVATAVDHSMFTERLADAALDTSTHHYGLWTSIGGARFVEDYLDPAAADTPGYARLVDDGLTQLVTMGALGVTVSQEILTPRQYGRLAELRSPGK